MWGKVMNGQLVCGRYHCIMVRSFDFILGATTAALWKDIRFISERHVRYIVGGRKKKRLNTTRILLDRRF